MTSVLVEGKIHEVRDTGENGYYGTTEAEIEVAQL